MQYRLPALLAMVVSLIVSSLPLAVTAAVPDTPTLKQKATADKVKAAKLGKAYKEALTKGRKLVKASKYTEGIAAFESALKVDPNNPLLLSELGWAAFLAGDLSKAAHATSMAIRFAKSTSIKGASLYNLGRINEAQGDVSAAAKAYTESLAVRPGNKTVQKRLADLLTKGAVVAPQTDTTPCAFQAQSGSTIIAVCEALAAEHEQSYCYKEDIPSWSTTTGTKPLEASIVRFHVEDEWSDYFYLAVEVDDTWYTSFLGYEYNPGAFGIFEEFIIDGVVFDDLLPGGPEELELTFTIGRGDSDMGINEYEGTELVYLGVATITAGGPVWLLQAATSHKYDRDLIDPDLDDPDIAPMTKGLPITIDEQAAITFDATKGTVTVAPVAKKATSAPLGTFPLAEYPLTCIFPDRIVLPDGK